MKRKISQAGSAYLRIGHLGGWIFTWCRYSNFVPRYYIVNDLSMIPLRLSEGSYHLVQKAGGIIIHPVQERSMEGRMDGCL